MRLTAAIVLVLLSAPSVAQEWLTVPKVPLLVYESGKAIEFSRVNVAADGRAEYALKMRVSDPRRLGSISSVPALTWLWPDRSATWVELLATIDIQPDPNSALLLTHWSLQRSDSGSVSATASGHAVTLHNEVIEVPVPGSQAKLRFGLGGGVENPLALAWKHDRTGPRR